jgi:cell wall-associated NlpC family hydrolase
VTLAAATVLTALTAALLGAAAHADPGVPVPPIPGQGDVDRAKADVRDRQDAADRIQAALDTASRRLRTLEARAGLAGEAYDTAVAQAATATAAVAGAQARVAAALVAQQQAEWRLGAFAAETYRQGPDLAEAFILLHADSLHDFAVRQRALANHDAAEAQAVSAARQATQDATTAQQKADQAAADQRRAEVRAVTALEAARTAAADVQTRVAGIRAQQDVLERQLAAAQGIALGLERQREAGLAELTARQEAARQEAAREAAARQEAARLAAAAASQAAASAASKATESGSAASASPSQATSAASSAPAADGVPDAQGSVRLMLSYIYAQLGKPYVWGGAGPDVFDCSGLAMRGLEAGGWSFPHPAQWQYLAMHPLTYDQLRPGDLVFWAADDTNPHSIYHEAIYIGNDRIIQAPHPGGVVEEQSLWINGTPSFYGRP